MDTLINIFKNNIINEDNNISTISKKKILKHNNINENKNIIEPINTITVDKHCYNIINKKIDNKNDKDNTNNIELVNTMTVDYINNRINNEFCDDVINKIKDTYMLNEYKECKSVNNEIKKSFGEVYSTSYKMSFAGLAQAHRHRTINYRITDGTSVKGQSTYSTPFWFRKLLRVKVS